MPPWSCCAHAGGCRFPGLRPAGQDHEHLCTMLGVRLSLKRRRSLQPCRRPARRGEHLRCAGVGGLAAELALRSRQGQGLGLLPCPCTPPRIRRSTPQSCLPLRARMHMSCAGVDSAVGPASQGRTCQRSRPGRRGPPQAQAAVLLCRVERLHARPSTPIHILVSGLWDYCTLLTGPAMQKAALRLHASWAAQARRRRAGLRRGVRQDRACAATPGAAAVRGAKGLGQSCAPCGRAPILGQPSVLHSAAYMRAASWCTPLQAGRRARPGHHASRVSC